MSRSILVYAPGAPGEENKWAEALPGCEVAVSEGELLSSLERRKTGFGRPVCLLAPRDMADLASLSLLAEKFSGWRVTIELPENSPASLRLARPLSPRFFSFRNESRKFIFEVVEWMARDKR